MKRDMHLIRKIALFIESETDIVDSTKIPIDGYSVEEICYHCELMHESDLIMVLDSTSYNSVVRQSLIERLTSKGHDFVDSARDETLWNKTQKNVTNTVGGVAIDVLLKYLKAKALEMLGLPPGI